MQIHELISPAGSRRRRRIVGRGPASGLGKTSGRGTKGQKARAGRGLLFTLEGGQMPLLRRLPKVGFRSKRPIVYEIVPLKRLTRFPAGSVIDFTVLREKGLIKSPYKPYKILGKEEIQHPLTVKAYAFSKSAADQIIKAGGRIEAITRKQIREAYNG
jgi:large subunit ribosomal protein L15